MTMGQHAAPCKACPWRRTSAKGWLGNSTTLEFLSQAEHAPRMPCHCTIDYDDPNWKETQLGSSPRCAGHAAYLRNRCKLPHDPELRALCEFVGRRDDVFTSPDEFVEHHGGDVSRIAGVLLGFDDGADRPIPLIDPATVAAQLVAAGTAQLRELEDP